MRATQPISDTTCAQLKNRFPTQLSKLGSGAKVTLNEFVLEHLKVTAHIQIEGSQEEIARDVVNLGAKTIMGKLGMQQPQQPAAEPASSGRRTDFRMCLLISARKAIDLGDKVKIEVHDVVFLERTQDKLGILKFFNNPPVRAAMADVLSAQISAAVSRRVGAELEKAGLV